MTKDHSRFDVPGQLASLRRYALSLTRNVADAEDLVHDALVKAYERRSSFRRTQSLRSWLLSILHNSFVDGMRSRGAEVRRLVTLAEATETTLGPPQDHVVRLSQVRQAFCALPEEQRSTLHLVAVEGLSYAEAATTLGVAVGTVMSRVNRARATLRALEDAPGLGDGTRRRTLLKVVGGRYDPNR
jgi:RNA polymerase sigma-70 factor (ECF subfamily)